MATFYWRWVDTTDNTAAATTPYYISAEEWGAMIARHQMKMSEREQKRTKELAEFEDWDQQED